MKGALAIALALAFASPAAADAPRATTLPADVLAPVVVNGNGTVNDGGRRATWWFEYVAPWSPQPMTTPFQDIPASPDDQPVTAQFGTIASGTTYRYRLVLQLSDACVYGDWVEFTTPTGPVIKGPPPVPRLDFSTRPLHIAPDKTVGVLLHCRPVSTACRGTLQIKDSDRADARPITHRVRFVIGPGKWKRVRLALTRAGRQLGPADDGMLLFIEARGVYGPTSLTGAARQLSAK